jgi:hypothetical protein
MKLEFDSIEEVKDFVTKLKGTRGGKADKDDGEQTGGTAPEPLKPPTTAATAFNPGNGFAPPAGGAGPGAAGPFAAAATGPAPEVLALVSRINVRIDGAIASGQSADEVLAWFRGELQKAGVDASSATLDQIKSVLLAKAPVPALEGIAKLMNA